MRGVGDGPHSVVGHLQVVIGVGDPITGPLADHVAHPVALPGEQPFCPRPSQEASTPAAARGLRWLSVTWSAWAPSALEYALQRICTGQRPATRAWERGL